MTVHEEWARPPARDEWIAQFDRKHPYRVWPHSDKTDGSDVIVGRNAHMQACTNWLCTNMPRSGEFKDYQWDIIGWTFAFTNPKHAMAFSLACKDVILVETS